MAVGPHYHARGDCVHVLGVCDDLYGHSHFRLSSSYTPSSSGDESKDSKGECSDPPLPSVRRVVSNGSFN